MVNIGVKDATTFQNHHIEDIYGVGKVKIAIVQVFLDDNITTELSGLPIFLIVGEHRPAAPSKSQNHFVQFR